MSRIQSRRLSLSSGSWIALLSGSRFRGRRKFAARRSRGWLMSRYSAFYDPPTRGSRHPWNLRCSAFALHEFVPCRWKSLSRESELACNRRPTRLEDVANGRRTRLCATGVAAFRPPFRRPSPDCQLLHDPCSIDLHWFRRFRVQAREDLIFRAQRGSGFEDNDNYHLVSLFIVCIIGNEVKNKVSWSSESL